MKSIVCPTSLLQLSKRLPAFSPITQQDDPPIAEIISRIRVSTSEEVAGRTFSTWNTQAGQQPGSGKSTSVECEFQEALKMVNLPSRRWLLLALTILLACLASSAQIISVTFAPPALPVYEQPLCPGEGYLWTPGYWAYDYNFGDYYWVPGTWVLAPEPGLLWTPPYWGWGGNAFIFHAGYWGPQVGFYGGIPYGYGYFGHGYEGGRWEHGQFYYNRSVNNINVTNIRNVYVTNVHEDTNVRHVSYNGGNGGINARPSAQEEAAAHERHVPPVAAQTQHVQTASANRELRADNNHGKPPIAATDRPTAFSGSGVVPAKQAGAPYSPPANRHVNEPNARATAPAAANEPASRPSPPMHAKDLPPNYPRPAAANTAQAQQKQQEQQQQNKQYQQQQEKLYQQQAKERQQLQKSQEQEHQKMAQQQANAERQQQMERQHQQQTQQMVERHQQQQQQMQSRQPQQTQHGAQPQHGAPPPPHGGATPEKH
jgi:WXXGXW repeat (2 copies)